MQVVKAGTTEMGMEIEMKMEMGRNRNTPKQPNSLVMQTIFRTVVNASCQT